nr:hypothetical protein [Mycoplasmopsis bovis]
MSFSYRFLAVAKKYSKNGIEEINQFSENDNLIIKGNNLIALASLALKDMKARLSAFI